MKQLRNRIKYIFIAVIFVGITAVTSIVPMSALALNSVPQQQTQAPIAANSIPEQNANEIKHLEQNENGLVKFGFGMLWVLISALVIFFGLKLYKKYFITGMGNSPDTFGQKNSLDSPKDIKSAINLFLDKTDEP